ncbi:efflux RND transporter periplasmic adaptor subunit [Sulfuriflexus sp.]|uniref:efflux RND transporter periplasmic adaptor subunit n=1 Tax=Sulfuriflexus sp. TaxID=2015443 RepID=UPI0028CE646F|nr:efflux RND transporter periplasmic adaptor subunit [Sulfuriflexus sp.]MDT8403423.1 efflux RND transporter periplasmic adaptor subunit [Sulfuriflexus sp.]
MPVSYTTASNRRGCKKHIVYQTLAAISMVLAFTACSNDAEDKMSKNETAVEHAGKHLDARYVCPMHPHIIKDKAGESCPICGMDLVEKKSDITAETYPVVELTSDIVQKLGVRTSRVEKGQLWKLIKTVGYVGFNEDRLKTITTKTDGWIENLAVRVKGLYVRKGQLLFELYSPEFLRVQKEFIAAQKMDESGIRRHYSSRNESIPSRDHLRYMEIPQSMINEMARKGKVRHRIPYYAPMQGTVIRHNINKNQYISEGDELLTIADFSTLWVEANVYEHQLSWLRLGLNADIEVKALPGKKYKGEVNFINPVLDAKTRSLKVRLRVPNTDGGLRPNMFAHVKICLVRKIHG